MSNGAQQVSSASTTTTYRVLRELARRSQRSFVAVRNHERSSAVFVMNRFGKEEHVSPEAIAILHRDAQCLAKNWHPNIARVRHVDLVSDDNLYIATEMLDGITLVDLLELAKGDGSDGSGHATGSTRAAAAAAPVLPPAILARIFLDILSGLSALHGLRDDESGPLSMFHGELCPANVVVGKDGVARIVNVFRPRPVMRISNTSEALCYASPETIAGEDEQQDVRVDIYAVGVMLWEALMGRPLYEDASAARIAQRQREEDVPRPPGPLGDVAMRALAFDPGLRFRTAQDAGANLRAFAQTAVAAGSVVAQLIVDLAGDRIRARRAELEPLIAGRTISGQRRAVQLPTRTSDVPLQAQAQEQRETTPPSSGPQQKSTPPSGRSRPPMPPLSFRSEPQPVVPSASASATGDVETDLETVYTRLPSSSSSPPASVPSPLPPRKPTGMLTPASAISLQRPTPAPPLPPARRPPLAATSFEEGDDDDDDDDDLPGPRQSTPDIGYLDVLAASASASSPEELDATDILEDDDDDNALVAAREIVVSPKSVTPVPQAPSQPPLPALERLTAPMPVFPSFPKSAPILNTSGPPNNAPPPLAFTPPLHRPPSTRTPFVVDVLPVAPLLVAAAATTRQPNDRHRLLIVIGAIAAAAVLVLLIGATFIARRHASDGSSVATPQHDPGPSTVIVAPPPPPVDPLPPPSASADTNKRR